MNFEEFLTRKEEKEKEVVEETEIPSEAENGEGEEIEQPVEEIESSIDLDVQKAVVESLAADKAVQDETINKLTKENEELQKQVAILENQVVKSQNLFKTGDETIERLNKEKNGLQTQIELLKRQLAEQNVALNNVGEILSKNSETGESNKVALLDRDMEMPDRFPGETRDQVLEAIKEARDKAEQEGRIRRAQLLEGVLLANEPSGNLQKKRAALEKFFNDNQNVISGRVIAELEKYGISHKNGDEYLLPSEIIKRTY